MKMFTLEEAINLCTRCEQIAPRFGFHTALTGGCLYKPRPRKDADILFYEHSGHQATDKDGLLNALRVDLGFTITRDFGRVVKSTRGDQSIDLLFPGYEGEYAWSDDADEEEEIP